MKVVIVLKVLCYIDVSESNQVTDDGGGGNGGGVDVTCYLVSPSGFRSLVGWLSAAVALNVALGVASLWSCYANHFLHWGALATWALLLAQGRRNNDRCTG